MDDMEAKLGAILGNPQMMQQIMTMAQTLGASQESAPAQQSAPPAVPEIDPVLLGKIMGLAGQSRIDEDQKALLNALSPYLSHDRLRRLERAMQGARTAAAASGILGQGGLSFLTGR